MPQVVVWKSCKKPHALDRHVFVDRPTWGQLRLGARPPPVDAERGEWQHGNPLSGDRDFCHIMCCGPGAGLGMRCSDAPPGLNSNCSQSCSERWWLRLPLNITDETCASGAALDTMGRHRAACPRSGLLKLRAQGLERSLARICREAGASVRFNAKLPDMKVAVCK